MLLAGKVWNLLRATIPLSYQSATVFLQSPIRSLSMLVFSLAAHFLLLPLIPSLILIIQASDKKLLLLSILDCSAKCISHGLRQILWAHEWWEVQGAALLFLWMNAKFWALWNILTYLLAHFLSDWDIPELGRGDSGTGAWLAKASSAVIFLDQKVQHEASWIYAS